MFARLLKFADSVLFGSLFELMRANNIVEAKIRDCTVSQFASDERLRSSEGRLDDALAVSVDRVRRIETKAMGTLLGVSVGVAILGLGSGVLGPTGVLASHTTWIQAAAAILLVAAMIYLFGSVLLALKAYAVGEIYAPKLFDREPLVQSQDQAMIVLFCIEQNERVGTMRSNRLSTAFSWLRNGLALVLLLGVLIVASRFVARIESLGI